MTMGTLEQLIVNGLIAGSAYGLLAISFALLFNTARFFNFAHGAVYTVGAYASCAVVTAYGGGAAGAVIAAVLAAGALGGLLDIAVYRPLRARHASPAGLLLASLGLLLLLQNTLSLLFGDAAKAMPEAGLSEVLSVGRSRITTIQAISVIAAGGLSAGVVLWLRRSTLGRALRAVASDDELAWVLGWDRNRIILVAVVVGSCLAGVASVFAAYDTGLRPTMGFAALLACIVAMVVGGTSSMGGAYSGGLILGVVLQFGAWVLGSRWQDAIVLLVLVLFLLVRPQGIWGRPLRKAEV